MLSPMTFSQHVQGVPWSWIYIFQPFWQKFEDSAQAHILFVFSLNKNTTRPTFKPSNNPTSAKFSDCNQVHQSCRLLKEAAVQVEETEHGQDNKRSAGIACVWVPGGETVDICDQKVIKYRDLWDMCKNIHEYIQKDCCGLPFYQLSVAKLSLYNSLETRMLIWQISTVNLALDEPGYTHI